MAHVNLKLAVAPCQAPKSVDAKQGFREGGMPSQPEIGQSIVSVHPLLAGLAERHRTMFNTLHEQAVKVSPACEPLGKATEASPRAVWGHADAH